MTYNWTNLYSFEPCIFLSATNRIVRLVQILLNNFNCIQCAERRLRSPLRNSHSYCCYCYFYSNFYSEQQCCYRITFEILCLYWNLVHPPSILETGWGTVSSPEVNHPDREADIHLQLISWLIMFFVWLRGAVLRNETTKF